MKICIGISLALLNFGIITAKSPVRDKFQHFYSKPAPLNLDDSSFSRLTAQPRNYSVAVLLTAMDPRFGCKLCHEFHPEWDLLSKSWIRTDKQGETRLLFATLDFNQGRNTFQALGLQSAPVLMLFQPTHGSYAISDALPARLEFTNGPQSAEMAHAWITRYFDGRYYPQFKRPFNWKRLGATIATIFVVITIIGMTWNYILPILMSRNIWAGISLISIILFTSGHMFNHIRKVPYVSGDGNGGIAYFSGGFSNQFGLETQIISSIYGLLSFATISLALKVPRIADPVSQQIAVLAWSSVIFLTYSLLLNFFRIKNGGYPFWLPPFS
ncbi:Magnesium transporter protein 1 [Erysiphe necator]|uniref:Putative oligosaccharyl transferase subunit n=1 Tax=Uncinula necator TaxID=52586 RepID=A0A0B1PE81_UNCNE|nr:Magnesium transporter protein 1 [Erysiphe necator]KHJ34934.1 putative oligosaccharyl transferase subunit [Erysiphe necator]